MNFEVIINKHYIEVEENNNITKGFSDVFQLPNENSILINLGRRQFELLGEINPNLQNRQGIYLYKYIHNEVIKKTQEEIDLEVSELKPIEPTLSEIDLVKQKLKTMEEIVDELIVNSLEV